MATVRKRGDKWQAIVRIKKHGVIIHQESRTFSTEKLAKTWADKVEATVKINGVQARSSITLRELIEKYWVALEEVKPLRRTRSWELGQLMAHPVSRNRVVDLTAETFVSFARERRKEAGPATVLHNLATFRSVLGSAKAMLNLDVTNECVVTAIQMLRRTGHVANSRSRSRRLSHAEEVALIEEFRRTENHPTTHIPMEKIMLFALALPRRREEICKMEWANLNERTRTILLKDTKHPRIVRDEIVPIPQPAWDIIQSMPRSDARIFPFNADSVGTAFERARDRLGLTDLKFHDLRHEGVSRLFELGLDLPEVAVISGHSWGMLRRYTHLRPSAVLEKLDARIKEAQKTRAQSEKRRADHVDHPDGAHA